MVFSERQREMIRLMIGYMEKSNLTILTAHPNKETINLPFTIEMFHIELFGEVRRSNDRIIKLRLNSMRVHYMDRLKRDMKDYDTE